MFVLRGSFSAIKIKIASFMASQPPPKGLIAGLIKGNQWSISPSQSASLGVLHLEITIQQYHHQFLTTTWLKALKKAEEVLKEKTGAAEVSQLETKKRPYFSIDVEIFVFSSKKKWAQKSREVV